MIHIQQPVANFWGQKNLDSNEKVLYIPKILSVLPRHLLFLLTLALLYLSQ